MNAKGSKNARENRGTKSVMLCPICGEERKPIRVMTLGKNAMGYQCTCGLLSKSGRKIDL